MARLFIHLLILLLVVAGGHEAPAKVTGGLELAGTGVVKKIVDGDTLILDDGREVRLVGIQAPQYSLKNLRVQPLIRPKNGGDSAYC